MKKRILVFGDSNTWGWCPENITTLDRWSDEERWTGIMQQELGDDYVVINEGLYGRTTVLEDPIEENRCGKEHLLPIMDTQSPLDLVIIFLGTNDLKTRFSVSAWEIAQGAGLLVQKALAQTRAFRVEPKVLLMAPPKLSPTINQGPHVGFWGNEGKSKDLGKWYKEVAAQLGVAFVDTDQIVKSSEIDGLHLDKDQHELLGREMASAVRKIL